MISADLTFILWQVSDEEDLPVLTMELKLGENIFEIHITKVRELFFGVCSFRLKVVGIFYAASLPLLQITQIM